MKPNLPDRINVAEVLAHSYRDFHTKGLDYVCLRRSLTETWKLYFFEGAVENASEVVHPHDHRYNFDTHVITGAVENVVYKHSSPELSLGAKPFNRFEWRTPLNPGPHGFTFAEECHLKEVTRMLYEPDGAANYYMEHDAIHTIRIVAPQTVLLLKQYDDRVPLHLPTSTYSRGDAPAIDGLYSRFTADSLLAKLKNFEERTGIRFETI